jgi:hypothetical protein
MSMTRNIVIETTTGKVIMYGYADFTQLSVNDYDPSTMSIIENTSFVFEPPMGEDPETGETHEWYWNGTTFTVLAV